MGTLQLATAPPSYTVQRVEDNVSWLGANKQRKSRIDEELETLLEHCLLGCTASNTTTLAVIQQQAFDETPCKLTISSKSSQATAKNAANLTNVVVPSPENDGQTSFQLVFFFVQDHWIAPESMSHAVWSSPSLCQTHLFLGLSQTH